MNTTSSPSGVLGMTCLEASKLEQALDHIRVLRALESRYFLSIPFFSLVLFLCYLTWLSSATTPVVDRPVAGYRHLFDPTFLLRLRFVFNAVGIMNDGYYKVRDS
jgi:hypothetical protein